MQGHIDLPDDAVSAFVEGDPEAAEQAARFLKSIAHRDRLRLLCALLQGEQTVAAIEKQVGASQSAISQHLARLKAEGTLASRRDGRQTFYSIADTTVRELIELLYLRFCAPE